MSDPIDDLVSAAYDDRYADWEGALLTFNSWLSSRCRDALGPTADPSRLVVEEGRIKDAHRAGDKVRRKVAAGAAAPGTVEELERLITDLVATKVLCKSTRDQALLADWLVDEPSPAVPWVDCDDYCTQPKASGYRARHFLFRVPVPDRRQVTIELQIKTRLQDAWGELTHEDLYKPQRNANPAAFHGSVALTMANLLAEVDRLADDLAVELERTLDPDQPASALTPRQTTDSASHLVTVRRTGPRYALAVDGAGRQGMIRAADVKRWQNATGFIAVDDYVHVGDRLRVHDVTYDEIGSCFVPVGKLEPDAE